MFRIILIVILATKVLTQTDSLHEGSFKVKKKNEAVVNFCNLQSKDRCLWIGSNDSITWPVIIQDAIMFDTLLHNKSHYLNKKAQKLAKENFSKSTKADKCPKGISFEFSVVINSDGSLGSIESIEAPNEEFKDDMERKIKNMFTKNWKPATLYGVPVSSMHCWSIYYGKSKKL